MFKFIALLLLPIFAFAGDLPDPIVTPGAINPNVTQENIQSTICVSGWTKTIRPPASYTNKLKAKQLKDGVYKSDLPMNAWEEDHRVALEVGGHPTDERNLYPEHWSSPWGAHEKDHLENKLHGLVCSGKIPLIEAQLVLSGNWIDAYNKYMKVK